MKHENVIYCSIDETTERCYCEHENGKNPNNGIMCKTPTGSASRIAHCASEETCTGPTSGDECSLWPLRPKKADLCTGKCLAYVLI